jgi:hypothetical protein
MASSTRPRPLPRVLAALVASPSTLPPLLQATRLLQPRHLFPRLATSYITTPRNGLLPVRPRACAFTRTPACILSSYPPSAAPFLSLSNHACVRAHRREDSVGGFPSIDLPPLSNTKRSSGNNPMRLPLRARTHTHTHTHARTHAQHGETREAMDAHMHCAQVTPSDRAQAALAPGRTRCSSLCMPSHSRKG